MKAMLEPRIVAARTQGWLALEQGTAGDRKSASSQGNPAKVATRY
jgi:hypothetical protein